MTDLPFLIRIITFGYKYSGLPEGFARLEESGGGGGFVFDCRTLPNPFWEEELRGLTGLDAEIRRYMERHPECREFVAHAAWLVMGAARARRDRGEAGLRAALGCTGGRHRSVWTAERLGEALEEAGFRVEMRHTDIDSRPVAGEPA